MQVRPLVWLPLHGNVAAALFSAGVNTELLVLKASYPAGLWWLSESPAQSDHCKLLFIFLGGKTNPALQGWCWFVAPMLWQLKYVDKELETTT